MQRNTQLEAVNGVEPPVTKRALRPVAEAKDWASQRKKWQPIAELLAPFTSARR
jgi:hypothetical protein